LQQLAYWFQKQKFINFTPSLKAFGTSLALTLHSFEAFKIISVERWPSTKDQSFTSKGYEE